MVTVLKFYILVNKWRYVQNFQICICTNLSPKGNICENGGGGSGRGGSEEADGAGLWGDDGFDGSASGALRICSGDSRPALERLEHSLSRTISSSWTTSGELVAVESSTSKKNNKKLK